MTYGQKGGPQSWPLPSNNVTNTPTVLSLTTGTPYSNYGRGLYNTSQP